MFKKCKVVMLPTNEKAIRPLLVNPSTGKMEIPKHTYDYPASEYQKVGYKTVYLYFLSDEEIKDVDWIYRRKDCYETIQKAALPLNLTSVNKKIIATTDTLSILVNDGYLAKESPTGTVVNYLPQPSHSFIEKFVEEYNKGNVITEVMVEYEWNKTDKKIREVEIFDDVLKINPKDNTITIRKVKDSWNRKEVIALLHHFRFCGDDVEKFAEENL